MTSTLGRLECYGCTIAVTLSKENMFAILGINGHNDTYADVWLGESEIPELIYLLNKAKEALHNG